MEMRTPRLKLSRTAGSMTFVVAYLPRGKADL